MSDDFCNLLSSIQICHNMSSVERTFDVYCKSAKIFYLDLKTIDTSIQCMNWRTNYLKMSSSRDQCTLRYILVFLLSIYWNIISHNLHTNKNVNKIQYYRLVLYTKFSLLWIIMDKKMTYACKFLCKFVAFHQQRQDKNWKSFLMLTFCFKGPINTYFVTRNTVISPQITPLFSFVFNINSAKFQQLISN